MRFRKYLAFTLIELLVTVSVIGALATGAYFIYQNVSQSSANAKLEADVRQVNQSVKAYLANGGKIKSGLTADEVLAQLRRTAANPNSPVVKGTFISPRLTIRWQAPNEVSTSSPRAVWNDTTKQFEIATTGTAVGVKEFYVGEMPAPLPMGVDEEGDPFDPNTDEREGVADFDDSNGGKWVWKADGDGSRAREVPDITPTVGVDPGNADPQNNADATPLPPPLFSEVTGRYDISWFPGSITLSLPSGVSPTVAEIYYHTSAGPWTKFGAPIPVQPGDSIWAKTVSLDLDRFVESSEKMERYDQKAMKLEIAGRFEKDGYTYKELGGAMQGTAALVPPAAPINVTNIDGVPADQISSAKFQIYWTYDGSDPALATSTTRQSGPVFSGTYNPVAVGLALNHYSPAGTATVRVKAVAVDTEAYSNSDELTLTIGRLPSALPPTAMSLNSDKVVMNPIETDGSLPAGSRVFYTSNKTDPGDNGGEPAAGATLYTGPVTFPSGTLTEYTART